MLKYLKKVVRVFLWLFLTFSFLLILTNILISRYHTEVLSFFNIGKDRLQIRKVESVFLPFFLDISGIKFNFSNFSGVINSFMLETDLKKIFKGNFLNIKINGGNVFIRISNQKNKSSNTLGFIKKIVVNDISFYGKYYDYGYEGILKNFNLDKGKFTLSLKRVVLNKGNISEVFDSDVKGKVDDNNIYVDYILAKGNDLLVLIENPRFSDTNYTGTFSLVAKDKFLKLINKKLSGEVSVLGNFQKQHVKAKADLGKVRFDNKKLYGKIDFIADNSTISIDNAEIEYDKYKMAVDLFLNYKTKELKTYLHNIKNLNLNVKNEKLSITDLSLNGNYGNNKYFLKSNIYWREKITVSSNVSLSENTYFDNIKIKSKSIDFDGNGNLKNFKDFDGTFSGNIIDNGFIMSFFNVKHRLITDFSFKYTKDNFELTGNLVNEKPLKYKSYNVENSKISFNISKNKAKLKYNIQNSNDVVKGNANIDFTAKSIEADGNYVINLGKYFKYKQLQSAKGNYHIEYAGKLKGEISSNMLVNKRQMFVETKLQDSDLYITKVNYMGYRFKNLGSVDIKKKLVNLSFHGESFRYQNLNFENLNGKVVGKFDNPEININGFIKLTTVQQKFAFNIAGNLNKLTLNSNNNNLTVNSSLNVKEKKVLANVKINNFNYKKIDIATGNLNILSDTLKYFNVDGDLSGRIDKRKFNLSDLILKIDKFDIVDGKATLSITEINNLEISKIKYSKNKISGIVDLAKSKLFNEYIKNENLSGIINFYSADKLEDIYLKGKASLNCDLYLKKYGTMVKNVNADFEFNKKSVYSILSSNYLDSSFNGTYYIFDFTKPLEGGGYIILNNVFVNLLNFMGTINGYLSFSDNLLSGDIKVVKGIYNFRKFKKSKSSKKLPIKLDISLETLDPVVAFDKYFNSKLMAKLKIKYNEKLSVTGFLESVDSNLELAKVKFNVIQGRLNFSEDTPPYLSIYTRGTGKYKDILLDITGFLPEYNINIKDVSPNGSNFASLKVKGDSGNGFIQGLFNGEAFANVISVTNRLFGINDIGIGSDYNKLGYFSIGRKFSDRLGIKYRLKSGEEGNELVGEYSLFDWLNLNIISNSKGSSGAGFSFYYSF